MCAQTCTEYAFIYTFDGKSYCSDNCAILGSFLSLEMGIYQGECQLSTEIPEAVTYVGSDIYFDLNCEAISALLNLSIYADANKVCQRYTCYMPDGSITRPNSCFQCPGSPLADKKSGTCTNVTSCTVSRQDVFAFGFKNI